MSKTIKTMMIIKKNIPVQELDNIVLLIGNFDGIHLGHQFIIKQAKLLAQNNNCKLCLLSFYPHPLIALGVRNILKLHQPRLKYQKLQSLGVDILLYKKFNMSFAGISPEYFIKDFLLPGKNIKYLVVGNDFVFGKNKKGNIALLEGELKNSNIQLQIIDKVKIDEKSSQDISSSLIRENLQLGNIKVVNSLLGYRYSLTGIIKRGYGIGKKSLVPTANLAIQKNIFLPKLGIYVGLCHISYGVYKAAISVGINPSIENKPNKQETVVEAYIIDFNEEIYGQRITIEFLDYIREEKKFSNMEELKEQIMKDIEFVKNYA